MEKTQRRLEEEPIKEAHMITDEEGEKMNKTKR